MKRVCVLDLGTHSLLSLIAESGESEIMPLDQKLIIVRLGRSLHKDGLIPDEALRDAASAIQGCAETASTFGVERCVLVGTQAFRIAYNGSDAAECIRKMTGFSVEILTPEEEALYSFRGAAARTSADEMKGVLDIGGGSTEIAAGRDVPVESFSLPVGSLVCTNRFLLHDPPSREEVGSLIQEIEHRLDSIQLKSTPDRWIGVGGTVTTVAAVSLGLSRHDPEKIEGMRLSLGEVEHWFRFWLGQTVAQRKVSIQVDPSRAEIILGGTAILRTWMLRFGVNGLTVSDGGLRFGIAARELNRI